MVRSIGVGVHICHYLFTGLFLLVGVVLPEIKDFLACIWAINRTACGLIVILTVFALELLRSTLSTTLVFFRFHFATGISFNLLIFEGGCLCEGGLERLDLFLLGLLDAILVVASIIEAEIVFEGNSLYVDLGTGGYLFLAGLLMNRLFTGIMLQLWKIISHEKML
jgi:hypothetical protein